MDKCEKHGLAIENNNCPACAIQREIDETYEDMDEGRIRDLHGAHILQDERRAKIAQLTNA